ncbi:hypothetical protein NDU88_008968 [Pleurodeles waltl]|uniref:Uncharacterized protein n=1 Tax=Pleurodeles waltl TaxID=8319 RepID=A0AAV7PQS2_PLEWA|nr:hypothetical protein NDU88_008968 [Pleurodeles waltl]
MDATITAFNGRRGYLPAPDQAAGEHEGLIGLSPPPRSRQRGRLEPGWVLVLACPATTLRGEGGKMGRHQQTAPLQGNTMEQYTTPMLLPQRQTRMGELGEALDAPATAGEPTRADLLAAIRGTRVALEGKIEMVAVEVNLLRADLLKVSDKVKVEEGCIVDLQTGVGTLRKQMAKVTSTVGTLEARLEESEGRSRRKNVCLLGFPECAEGSTVESFVGQWIREVLQPEGLSRAFVVEHAHRALVARPRPGAPPMAITAHLLD